MWSGWLKAGVVAWSLMATLGWPQQPAPTTITPPKPYVLHVYANLVQVPALILTNQFKPVAPLTKDRIVIHLDSGPGFHPMKMHLEGDEPISLAILLDASDRHDALLRDSRDVKSAMAEFAQRSFNIQDSVSIYTVDCRLIRSGLSLPATPSELQGAIERGFNAPTLHKGKKGSCAGSVHLWDATAAVLKSLASLPGRRVLLIVSHGDDHNSATTWNQLREYADLNSIAIFGLRELMRLLADRSFLMPPVAGPGVYSSYPDGEDPFLQLCELSGGVVLATPEKQLSESLQRIIAMVRGRYILEFPRPDDDTPGGHSVDVSVPSLDTFITTAGVAIALPDPSRETDPTTVPSSPSPAVMGKRRVLSPH